MSAAGSKDEGVQCGAGVDPALLEFIDSNSMTIEGYTSNMPTIKEEAAQEQPRQGISKSLKDWIDEGVNYEAITIGRLHFQSEKFTAMFDLLSNADPLERVGWLAMLKNGVDGMSDKECEYLQEMFGQINMDQFSMECDDVAGGFASD